MKPDAFYAEAAVDLRLSIAATAIDRRKKTVSLSDGTKLPYDRLLITTGARVRKLPVPGAGLPGVYYLRGIADVDALRQHFQAGTRLAVVGGGYIGLEVAAVAVKHGLKVTVKIASKGMERWASVSAQAGNPMVQSEADAINARNKDWAYKLPEMKVNQILAPRETLLRPADEPGAGKAPAGPPAGLRAAPPPVRP